MVVPASTRQHRAPVLAQDLDPAEAPAETLALQGLEGERHDPVAERLVDVQAGPPGAQDPQRELGVLGDAPLVPSADRLERTPADEPHRAGEDRAVALVA